MKLLTLLFSLKGRISRRQFWLGKLLSILIFGSMIAVLWVLDEYDVLERYVSTAALDYVIWIMALPVLGYEYMSIALEVKRWHDLGRSMLGFLVLHGLPIVGSLVAALIVGFLEGVHGPNKYGRDPIERPGENDDLLDYGRQ